MYFLLRNLVVVRNLEFSAVVLNLVVHPTPGVQSVLEDEVSGREADVRGVVLGNVRDGGGVGLLLSLEHDDDV